MNNPSGAGATSVPSQDSNQSGSDDRSVVTTASEQAIQLFERALRSVADQNKAASIETPTRLFFPSGIELITIKFNVGTAAKIVFTVAGKDAKYGPGDSLTFEEVSEELGDIPDDS